MSDQFKGEVYVTSGMDKERFEQAAYRCGYSVAIDLVGEEAYHLMFYVREGKKNAAQSE